MTYAPVNGLRLYYEIHGSGRPIVCSTAACWYRSQFRSVARAPGAGRQVIAVELQGHGRTADTARPMSIEALAGDVVALLDRVGIAAGRSVRPPPWRSGAFAVTLGAPPSQADRHLGGCPPPPAGKTRRRR